EPERPYGHATKRRRAHTKRGRPAGFARRAGARRLLRLRRVQHQRGAILLEGRAALFPLLGRRRTAFMRRAAPRSGAARDYSAARRGGGRRFRCSPGLPGRRGYRGVARDLRAAFRTAGFRSRLGAALLGRRRCVRQPRLVPRPARRPRAGTDRLPGIYPPFGVAVARRDAGSAGVV
ncbi:MAG: Tripartite tricarboxylate transporter TctB family, partial [uncultured Truepera sp.]